MEVVKSLTLNLLEPTDRKQAVLTELRDSYRQALSFVVSKGIKVSRTKLQNLFYKDVRNFGLHSQIANDLFKDAVAILNNGGKAGKVTIPYNVPRSGKLSTTRAGNPVVSMAVVGGRVAVPIAMDGAYERFAVHLAGGWEFTHFRLNGNRLHVTLKKEFAIPEDYDAVLGVDVGSHRLAAVSVISREGRILRQLYFGQDVGAKQRDISVRRSRLKGYADKGSREAVQALRRLREYENNYTTTRCWQVAHQIVKLAEMFNAFIGIEDLTDLLKARGNRKGNRKSKRIPYGKFRVALESVAGQHSIHVEPVEPRDTSKTCSRCGRKGNRNRGYFRCPYCGYEANSDRNASVNIAIRAGISHPNAKNGFFSAQTPDGNLAVNPGDFVHDGFGLRCLQHPYQSSTHAHGFSRG